jgi:hypothetical protein
MNSFVSDDPSAGGISAAILVVVLRRSTEASPRVANASRTSCLWTSTDTPPNASSC